MVRQIIKIFLLLICFNSSAQQYIGNNGIISFFSEAPMEDIKAINSKVSSVYDSNTNEIVFQLRIQDFIFPKKLMQEHFNENYLESEKYPNALFNGSINNWKEIVITNQPQEVSISGEMTIHGVTNFIKETGVIYKNNNKVNGNATFRIQLEDYDVKIPKILIKNIAESVEIKMNLELKKK